MVKKTHNWLVRLIDKITRTDCNNNNSFSFYGNEVMLSSNTRGYVAVTIYNQTGQISFDFDFWTKRLHLESFTDYKQCYTIVNTFWKLYNETVYVSFPARKHNMMLPLIIQS